MSFAKDDLEGRLVHCGIVMSREFDIHDGAQVAQRIYEISLAMPTIAQAIKLATERLNEKYGECLDFFKEKGWTGNTLTARAKAGAKEELALENLADRLEASMAKVITGLSTQLSRLKEEEKRANNRGYDPAEIKGMMEAVKSEIVEEILARLKE